jgi:outer membrane cobalamin receptor
MPGAALPTVGSYIEALETRRADIGSAFQALSASGIVWSARGSWTSQHQEHRFGDVIERDDHDTGFVEFTARRAIARHTIVAGVAIERDRFQPIDTPRFAYSFTTPGVFVQDDLDVARWLALSGSARLDHHSEYGVFVSPRLSALVRRGGWSSRASYGTGFFAPTPITEETESTGLSHLAEAGALKAERGTSASFDLTRTAGALATTLTIFHSSVHDPIDIDRNGQFTIRNLMTPTTNSGLELLAVWKAEDFSLVANYAYVRSREDSDEGRVEVRLTPRHSIGLDAAREWAGGWRLGAQW